MFIVTDLVSLRTIIFDRRQEGDYSSYVSKDFPQAPILKSLWLGLCIVYNCVKNLTFNATNKINVLLIINSRTLLEFSGGVIFLTISLLQKVKVLSGIHPNTWTYNVCSITPESWA